MENKITPSSLLECPECKDVSTVEQIDAYTFGLSLTREQRRRYKSIVDVWNRPVKNKKMCYCCPNCTRWSTMADWKKAYKEEEKKAEELKDGEAYGVDEAYGEAFSIKGLSDELDESMD